MASRRAQALATAADETAIVIEGSDAVRSFDLLVRAIDHARLWHELAWDGPQAAVEARRDVARARRMAELAAQWARERAGEYGEGQG